MAKVHVKPVVDDLRVQWFGPSWDAVINGACDHIETPSGECCAGCGEVILNGQRGVSMWHGPQPGERLPWHLECLIKAIVPPATSKFWHRRHDDV
jgi:hypothetical protein